MLVWFALGRGRSKNNMKEYSIVHLCVLSIPSLVMQDLGLCSSGTTQGPTGPPLSEIAVRR